jgi:GNAT superfamily N-acetyltransferase
VRARKVDPEQYADVLLSMDEACFPGDKRPGLHGDWWLIEEGDVLKAYCALWPSVRQDGAGYLARAGVLPEARGLGLQRRMIRLRERAAKAKGWNLLFSDTSKENVASSNNMIRCGYKLWRPSDPWSFDDALYWRKVIGSAG